MNRVKVRQGEQKGIERMELAVQFLYNVLITAMTVVQGWSILVVFVFWGFTALCCALAVLCVLL